MAVVSNSGGGLTIWSQYYRVQYFAADQAINVNGIPHQSMTDINGTSTSGRTSGSRATSATC